MEITLFEYDKIKINWTEEEQLEVRNLKPREPNNDQSIPLKLGEERGEIYLIATQYIGIFRLGNRTVQVLPKMYRAKQGESNKKQALRNLLYMLGYVKNLDIDQYWLDSLQGDDLNWLEVLIESFATNLLKHWHQGAFRSYQAVSDTLPVLKGKWNLTEQLCHPERKHVFSVTYDNFTADNKLNQILRYVVERLWKLTQISNNRQKLNKLRQAMDEVTLLSSINIEDIKRINITRLNQQYKPLLNLAHLFLSNKSLELFTGDIKAYTFVFDLNMDQLFEDFTLRFIEHHRHEIIPQELKDYPLDPQSMGIKYYMAKREGKNHFKVKPDLVIGTDGDCPMIIDTKYKKLKEEKKYNFGIKSKDFYQMYAYSLRYESPYVLLIYPQMADMSKPLQAIFKVKPELNNKDRKIVAATIDLRVDLSSKKEEQILVSRFKEIFKC